MYSKTMELTGLGLMSWAIAWAVSTPAGLLFAGAAIVLIGSVTDDAAVGMALRRGTAWLRYAWWRQIARESGLPLPSLKSRSGVVPCSCDGRDEDCPLCDGTGFVPDPLLRSNSSSPHPRIKVDPQSEEFWGRMAKARTERSKLRDRTPALSRQNGNDDLERIG